MTTRVTNLQEDVSDDNTRVNLQEDVSDDNTHTES